MYARNVCHPVRVSCYRVTTATQRLFNLAFAGLACIQNFWQCARLSFNIFLALVVVLHTKKSTFAVISVHA